MAVSKFTILLLPRECLTISLPKNLKYFKIKHRILNIKILQYSYIGQSSNVEYFREDCLLYIYFKTTHHKIRHKTVILLFLCMPDDGCKNAIYFLNKRR